MTRSGDAPAAASASAAAAWRACALARREILVERGAHDGMDEPQARSSWTKMSARTRSSAAAAATSSPSPVTPAASASSVSSPSTATARASSFAVRAERGEPVQHEPAHGRRADVLDLARGGGRRRDPGRVDGVQQLAQEQRVAARRRVTCAAELLRRVRAQALPCQRDRRGLAERPRVQRDRGGARGHLPPHRAGLVGRWTSREQHGDRQPLDALREEGQEAQRVLVDPVAVVDQTRAAAPGRRG